MDKVIGVDFRTGKRKDVKPDVEPDKDSEATPHDEARKIEDEVMLRMDEVMQFMDFVERELEIPERGQKILNLPASHNALAVAQQLIKGHSTKELRELLEGSDERDWARRPARFKAILLELLERLRSGTMSSG